MEPRIVLTADPVIAGVTYLEGDSGQDTTPDHFEVTFEGGAETTQLTQFVINGDQDANGVLSDGDVFFDVTQGLPGTGGHHPFVFDSVNSLGLSADDILDVNVSDNGLVLTVDVQNFDAGDRLAFTIDVDEVENLNIDKIASGVEFEGSQFQTTFQDDHFTFVDKSIAIDVDLPSGFTQNQQTGVFYDYYDMLFDEAELQTAQTLGLELDNETGQADRTAGAVDAYDLVPKPISISGTVYEDANLNWQQDSNELGLANVQIELQRFEEASGQYSTVATTQTDGNGNYEFGLDLELPPGEYRLVEIQPQGYLDVGALAGNVDGDEMGNVISDQQGHDNIITDIHIPLGNTAATDYDFKEIRPASISGHVYHDRNDDGVRDPGEEGLANVLIQIRRVGAKDGATFDPFENSPPIFVQTDATGFYRADGLPPGIYEIIEINNYPNSDSPLEGFIDGKDTIGKVSDADNGTVSNDRFTLIELCAGDVGVDYDFGELRPASIGGYVSVSTPEGDCLDPMDPNHRGIAGVTIQLLDANGQFLTETITNSNGYYEFADLAPGTYSIVEVQPNAYLDGAEQVGNVNGTQTGLLTNDRFSQIELTSDAIGTMYNFCEHIPAEIHGTVYHDQNDNGSLEFGEQRLGGVTVELLNADGEVIDLTTTNAQGEYWFNRLHAGTYSVREIQPISFADGKDSVGNIAGVKVGTLGQDLLTDIELKYGDVGVEYNFGEIRLGTISGTVHADVNGDCTLDPSQGDRPLAGVLLRLFDADGNRVAEATTNENGEYFFEDLRPGEYSVREFTPEGYIDGQETLGTINGVTVGQSTNDRFHSIVLQSGDSAINYDFCEHVPAELHGRVYHDLNDDGIHQPGEDGIRNVVIQLINENGEVIAEETTNAAGNYWFTGLLAGTYKIQEIQPDGFVDGKDRVGRVDGVANGELLNDMITNIRVNGGDKGYRYDFGEIRHASEIHGRVFVDGPAFQTDDGQLPDGYRDQRDGIYQEGIDTPLAGVRVSLFFYNLVEGEELVTRPVTLGEVQPGIYTDLGNDPNTPISVLTDENGQYWFTGLPAGNYLVLEQQPEDYFDANDIPGTTTGAAINSEDLPPPAGLIQFSGEQQRDTLFGINVEVGQASFQNNFTEVSVISTPDRPVVFPPTTQPPVTENPVTPNPGIQGLPGLFGAQPISSNLIGSNRTVNFQTEVGVSNPYTWHLSVVNGGQPREEIADAQINESIWKQASFISETDWQRFDMNDAVWVFTESRTVGDIVMTDNSAQFGMFDGTPLSGDFDGDGNDELAVFHSGYWMIDLNHNGRWDENDLLATLGDGEDHPVVGDWDGDGKDDIGIYGPIWDRDPEAIEREPGLPNPENDPNTKPKNVPPVLEDATNGARVMKLTSFGRQRVDVVDHVFGIGNGQDFPVTGDWNGNGIRSIGYFNAGNWRFDVNGDGEFNYADARANFGQAGDIPLVGDFNGDGIEEIAVYRAGTWLIDTNGNLEHDATDKTFQLGGAADKPVVGDFDGDGIDEPAIYRTNSSEFLR